MPEIAPEWTILITAVGLLVLVRSADIQLLVKTRTQRTKTEQRRVDWGLLRSILWEALLFVPVSAGLVLLTVAPLVPKGFGSDNVPDYAFFGLWGLASYGFPFVGIKKLVQRIALNTVKEFAAIAERYENPDDENDAS